MREIRLEFNLYVQSQLIRNSPPPRHPGADRHPRQRADARACHRNRRMKRSAAYFGGGEKTSTALRPPNANEFDITWRNDFSRPTLGT